MSTVGVFSPGGRVGNAKENISSAGYSGIDLFKSCLGSRSIVYVIS